MEDNNSIISLSQAVEAINTAILQGQYEALQPDEQSTIMIVGR